MNLIFIKLSAIIISFFVINASANDIKYLENKFSQDYEEIPSYIKHKKDSCLKFKKNGESFWENYETDFFTIKNVGSQSYKVKKIRFPKGHSDIWFFDKKNEKETISFSEQNKFYLTKCPFFSDKISDKDLSKLLE